MKNFRNSIIALATAATMLVPSVAMAASITATVDGEVNASNVFAGFYAEDGTLLKTEIGGTAVTETITTTTPGVAAPKEELTQPVVKAVLTENAGTYKLAFNITPDADMDPIATATAIFSYDNNVVEPLEEDAFVFYANPYGDDAIDTYAQLGQYPDAANNRTIVKAEAVGAPGTSFTIPEDGVNYVEFYFTVKDGQTITADTFKLEDDYDANPALAQAYGDRTTYTAAALFAGTQASYVRYGYYNGGEDTLTWAGFDLGEAVEPTDKAIVTATDEFVGISEEGNVHKLSFAVTAPAGTADVAATSVTFSYDSAVVSPVYSDDGAAIDPSDLELELEFVCPVYNDGSKRPFTNAITVETEGTVNTVTVDGEKNSKGAPMPMTDKIVFTEFYYVVNEGKAVDHNTFTFGSASFDEEEAEFAGLPWKAPESTTTTTTVTNITINDVEAPAEYANIKIFLWNDYQFAACDPVAGTLNN